MEFDWQTLLFGDKEWAFLLQIVFRTTVMYLVILTALTVLGKRGVKQLSVFELVIIIGLGSAAGDPMFYDEVGLLSGFTVFVVIIVLYKITTLLIFKSDKWDHIIEGKAIYLLENGQFFLKNFEKEPLAYDEFFGEMREKNVSHLGQVSLAIIEVSGELSLFFFEDDNIIYGLPILPHLYEKKICQISENGIYSCSWCGNTETIEISHQHFCPVCNKDVWVKSINTKRVT